jgi:hypothetical protein
MEGFRLGSTIGFVVHGTPFLFKAAMLFVRLANEMVETCTIPVENKPLNALEAKSRRYRRTVSAWR